MPAAQKHSGRACARPLRSQRCYPLLGTTIKPTTWRGAGSGATTQTDLVLAISASAETNASDLSSG